MFALLNAKNGHDTLGIKWQPVQFMHPHQGPAAGAATPSVWDLLAAPTVFLQQALVYRETLDSTALAAAIQQAVDLYPAFASRVTKDQAGRLALVNSSTGAAFLQGQAPAELSLQQLLTLLTRSDPSTTPTDSAAAAPAAALAAAGGPAAGVQAAGSSSAPAAGPAAGSSSPSAAAGDAPAAAGSSPAPAACEPAAAAAPTAADATASSSLTQNQQAQQLPLPELPDALFGHLPGALVPDYLNSPHLALTHVALVQLQGGGSLLGVRTSHLIGDWSSLRLLLRSIAAAYSDIMRRRQQGEQQPGQQQSRQQQGQQQPGQQQDSRLHQLQKGSPAPAADAAAATPAAPPLIAAAPLLNALILAARRQLPLSFQPVRFKLMTPGDAHVFERLGQLSSSSSSSSSSAEASETVDGGRHGDVVGDGNGDEGGGASPQPRHLIYHALPARIQQLKEQALADCPAAAGAGSGGCSSGESSSRWCTSHNVLLARVLQVFASLQGRPGLPHDVAITADMRARCPAASLQGAPQQLLQRLGQLKGAVGNFFASAILEDCEVERWSLGQIAQQLYAAVQRSCELWLPDLAWASLVMGLTDAELAGDGSSGNSQQVAAASGGAGAAGIDLQQRQQEVVAAEDERQQQQQHEQQQQQHEEVQQHQGQVTWTRLHAMGPRRLLQQQMQLGLLASLTTTQWPLEFQSDAAMDGQLPLLAAPSFSQPQPYPLVLMQQAPAALGGGVMVHMWLDGGEAARMEEAVAAQGGL